MKGPALPKNLIKIGKITAPRALKGELKLYLFSGEAPWQDSVEILYLKKDTEIVPFKVKAMESVFVKLEGIKDRTEAEKWVGAEVYIAESELETKLGESIYLREILGFLVMAGGVPVGPVISFETNNSQDLLVVEKPDKKTVLIPLIAEFLEKINYKEKIIFMKLPPGLLEVNS